MSEDTRTPDERIADLADEASLSKRRADAEMQFRDLDSNALHQMKRRAKTDLFYLTSVILGHDLLSIRLHGHYCKWKEKTRRYRYRLELLPRNHYKTTVNASESVQIALPNVDDVAMDYPWTLGPNVKMLISHETERGASRMLVDIAEAFLSKPLMLALFPECIPSPKKHRINKLELELPRTEHHREPTFDAIGAGGAAQGRHYHRLKLDDLIGERARDSETVMLGILDWFDNANSLLTRPKLDGWDLSGTRWTMVDVYSHAMEKFGIDRAASFITAIDRNKESIPDGVLAAYIRGALENGVPIFPEEFDMEFFSALRKNRRVWAAQYANNPLDEEMTEFRLDWLRSYNLAPNGDLIVFEGPTTEGGPRGTRRLKPRDLDRVVLVDPSMGESRTSDATGIVVTGTDWKNNIYILETIKKRLKPPQLIDTLFRLWAQWNPRVISIEEVNFSATYRYWFQRECSRVGVTPNIYGYKPGTTRSKAARVRGLSNFGAAGQVYCLESMTDFRDEWERFGVSRDYHLLDALAQGPEVWKSGLRDEDIQRMEQTERKLMQLRSEVTGY